jgi:hypothetical protein
MSTNKSIHLLLISVLLLVTILPFASSVYAQGNPSKLYKEAISLMNKGSYVKAAQLLEEAVRYTSNASYYRKLAESYVALNEFQKAADTYYKEASIHLELANSSGNMNTYLAVIAKANALNSEIDLYMNTSAAASQGQKLAKFEPAQGMYVGAYIELDEKLKKYGGDRFTQFNKETSKQHAMYFTYYTYGVDFPTVTASYVAKAESALKISLEPSKGLEAVKDDAYLRKFARDAKATGLPIFLRFASEMNGDWVKWHGDPKLYIEKFRLVAKVMREEAPNVAMLWSPNAVPVHNLNEYYPGDDAVDWVGISTYSVRFFNGDPTQPADHVNPLDNIDYIYKQYADRKPIMISEYGATHYSKAGELDTTDFAITKMSMLYHGAKLKYPRIKAINWFSTNNIITSSRVERQLNNFSLMDNTKLRSAYSKLLSDPYYKSHVVTNDSSKLPASAVTPVPSSNWSIYKDSDHQSPLEVNAWVKTYDSTIGKVRFELDGQLLNEAKQYPYASTINTSTLSVNQHVLDVILYDSKGKIASQKRYEFTVKAALPKLKNNEFMLIVGQAEVHTHNGVSALQSSPFVNKGSTMVPLRVIIDQLKADVVWDAAAQTITIHAGETLIVLKNGSTVAQVNNQPITLEASPLVNNGVTFVPLRFISAQLGANLAYDQVSKTIVISP